MERRIYLDELEAWAQRELGRPAKVTMRKLPWNVDGVAWTDMEGNACIALSSRLRGHPNAVMSTFYHEVAHHKQGDCARREADPTWEALSSNEGVSHEEYVNLPRERKANEAASRYIRGESAPYTPGTPAPKATAAPQRPQGAPTPTTTLTTKTPSTAPAVKPQGTPATLPAQPDSRTWVALAKAAADELATLTPALRSTLDAMPSTPERDLFRNAEVFAGAPLRNAMWRQEYARDRVELGKVEEETRNSARLVQKVSAFAGVECPSSIARLARGEGAAVRLYDLPAQPTRQQRAPSVEYATTRRQ